MAQAAATDRAAAESRHAPWRPGDPTIGPARVTLFASRCRYAHGPVGVDSKETTVPRTTTKVLAGVAVASLAAAGVAAVVNLRRGQTPDPDERAHMDELDARLKMAQEPGSGAEPSRIWRMLDGLQRNQGISVGRLRSWIAGMRQGTLSAEQAIGAESDFGALERQADQAGA